MSKNSRNVAGLLAKFESIRKHAQDILKFLNGLDLAQYQVLAIMLPSEAERASSLLEAQRKDRVKETKMILDEYWNPNTIGEVNSFLGISLGYIGAPSTVEEAKGTLRQLDIECDRMIGTLRALVTPLSQEDSDRLNKIRLEAADVLVKLDVNYEKNLNMAIEECEKGHYLASALIMGRIIVSGLDKIKGEKEEEKIKFLQDRGIIEKDRQDVKENIVKASRRARNFLSHRIDIFADSSDTFGMLGDCLNLLKIVAKLEIFSNGR